MRQLIISAMLMKRKRSLLIDNFYDTDHGTPICSLARRSGGDVPEEVARNSTTFITWKRQTPSSATSRTVQSSGHSSGRAESLEFSNLNVTVGTYETLHGA